MFLHLRVAVDDLQNYTRLRQDLSEAGFALRDEGRQKWGEKHGATTVYVLPPQSQVEIYFGQMGVAERVSRDCMPPEAMEALSIALRYVKCETAVDHTGHEVDVRDLLR